jgi:predicted metal-dependent hydrolase
MTDKLPYRIERSQRKTVALKICPDGTLLVQAPMRYPTPEIDRLIDKHRTWIESHHAMAERRALREQKLAGSAEQIEELYRRAKEFIPSRVSYFAERMGVVPTGVRITSAAKRFGSCSAKNSLCFSFRIMMYPPEAVDYVIVHELAHIRHHDHSPAFYAFVKSILPDYRHCEAILKEQI